MNPKRPIIRLQIDTAAKDALDSLCERRGMTQIAVTSRLLSWFVGQDELVQATILGLLSNAAVASLPEMLLKRVIAAAERPPAN
jgi:hypothetical protein